MYCTQCGNLLEKNSSFCANCGMKVEKRNQIDTSNKKSNVLYQNEKNQYNSEPVQNQTQYSQQTTDSGRTLKDKRLPTILAILIPILTFILMLGVVSSTYVHEHKVNKLVLSYLEEGEMLAQEGKFAEAKEVFHEALKLRNDFATLRQNLVLVEEAMTYDEQMNQAKDLLKEEALVEVGHRLSTLRENVHQFNPVLQQPLLNKINVIQDTVTVELVRRDIQNSSTLQELIEQLTTIEHIRTQISSGVKADILHKIVEVARDEAYEKLEQNQFADALHVVEMALQHVTHNEELTELKQNIVTAKDRFEREEQQRIEETMEAEAARDLYNQTEGIQLGEWEIYFDYENDLIIKGFVHNTGTVNMGEIILYYTVYDEAGNVLTYNYTFATPEILAPNEIGEFFTYESGVDGYGEVEVEINEMVWTLY
ncbi:zinc-ribbon domain-containing protein [Salirhabdus salicampi]|uniref:zinc-ribbon domain-containing protein n=1 Tax=Salirhabdus salicampi TaxID=476102 RepID=UPI0020C2D877|nr:zinc-ribbon domain-containing protein [Salirhabdus salicampi]MCP8615983.1 zinc ribbon domain-containing protein [Salirhabdus salicampi]